MAKKIKTVVKLQIQAGKANPAPPVGPALGQHGLNIQEFCTKFNEATKDQMGDIIPAEITIFEDRTFTFRSSKVCWLLRVKRLDRWQSKDEVLETRSEKLAEKPERKTTNAYCRTC